MKIIIHIANVPKSIGSRSSIQSILNEALDKNIFKKSHSAKDRRIKNYFLDNDFLIMVNNWLKKEYSYFTNINTNGDIK